MHSGNRLMGHTRPAALPAIAGYRVLVVDGTTRSALVVLSKGLAPVRWGRGGFFPCYSVQLGGTGTPDRFAGHPISISPLRRFAEKPAPCRTACLRRVVLGRQARFFLVLFLTRIRKRTKRKKVEGKGRTCVRPERSSMQQLSADRRPVKTLWMSHKRTLAKNVTYVPDHLLPMYPVRTIEKKEK